MSRVKVTQGDQERYLRTVTGRLAVGATWQRAPGKGKGSVAVASLYLGKSGCKEMCELV